MIYAYDCQRRDAGGVCYCTARMLASTPAIGGRKRHPRSETSLRQKNEHCTIVCPRSRRSRPPLVEDSVPLGNVPKPKFQVWMLDHKAIQHCRRECGNWFLYFLELFHLLWRCGSTSTPLAWRGENVAWGLRSVAVCILVDIDAICSEVVQRKEKIGMRARYESSV
jgi:hypothetical protein